MMVKANAGCAARAHVTRASAIRAHAQRLPLAVVVFLIALFFASVAYAADWYSVLYRSELDGSEQYIVSADDRWQAAAIICGKNKSYIDGLDDETRKKLSTNGGAFQTLAESLDDDWPAWNDETLVDTLSSTFGGDELGSLWYRMTAAYIDLSNFPYMHFNPDALSEVTVSLWQESCPTHIFAANIDPTLRGAANEALNIITDGGSVGGGAGGNTFSGFPITLRCTKGNYTSTLGTSDTSYWFNANGEKLYPYQLSDIDVTINATNGVTIPDGDYDIFVCLQCVNSTGTTIGYCNVAIVPSGSCEYRVNGTNTELVNISGRSITVNYIRWNGSDSFSAGVNGEVNSSSSFTFTANTVINGSVSNNSKVFGENGFRPMWFSSGSVGSGGGDDEPNPWPTPVPPEQPNVPDPPDVSPPPISGPVFPTDPPQEPTVTPEPEPTGTDYTVYLKAIIRQLNQVMVQMSNHCKHIRDQISTSANAIISNLHTFFDELKEAIDSNFSALNDYLEDLTKWYEDFTKDIVDDILDEFSTVESILRQILRKIGVSRGTPKEIETEVDDDFNFLEWLINFITSKLAGVIDEFVGDVGALINGVKDKFPFSIPWDIMAILALLDGVRATPRFEITLPAINGWWQQTTFVIDLSPFDSVASAVRIMINAWWVLVLVMKTNWMLMVMGDSTSLGERIANRISGGGE